MLHLTTDLVVAGREARGLTTRLAATVLLLDMVLALLSLRATVEVDFWLSEVTREVGTDPDLEVELAREALGATLVLGFTVLVLAEGRTVAELAEEERARGLVVAETLGRPAFGTLAATVGLAGLMVVDVVLDESLDAAGRAGGTGGLVLVLGGLVGTGADLGLDPDHQLFIHCGLRKARKSSPKTPDFKTFLTPSIFCPIFPSFPNVLLALFCLSLPLPLRSVSSLTPSFEGE
jgi:hypothetical protein